MVEFQAKSGFDTQAPFNMALATLMRLDKILQDIKKISLAIAIGEDYEGEEINKSQALAMKISLARQFFINAYPLIPNNKKAFLKIQISRLILPVVQENIGSSPTSPKIITRETYSYELDYATENFVMNVEDILQKEGYFMPPKNDPRFAFRRE